MHKNNAQLKLFQWNWIPFIQSTWMVLPCMSTLAYELKKYVVKITSSPEL